MKFITEEYSEICDFVNAGGQIIPITNMDDFKLNIGMTISEDDSLNIQEYTPCEIVASYKYKQNKIKNTWQNLVSGDKRLLAVFNEDRSKVVKLALVNNEINESITKYIETELSNEI